MKRTRELIHREHPEWQERANISNCQFFDGEDNSYYQRQKDDCEKQKCFIEAQKKENQLRKEQTQLENHLMGQQVLHLNRQRGILHDHVTSQKKALIQAQNQKNLELIAEKKEKEQAQKQQQREEDQEQLRINKLRGVRQN